MTSVLFYVAIIALFSCSISYSWDQEYVDSHSRSFRLTIINDLSKPLTEPFIYHSVGETVNCSERIDASGTGTFFTTEAEGNDAVQATSGILTFKLADRKLPEIAEYIAIYWKIPENEEEDNELKLAQGRFVANENLYKKFAPEEENEEEADDGEEPIDIFTSDIGHTWSTFLTKFGFIKLNIFCNNKIHAEATIRIHDDMTDFAPFPDTYIVPALREQLCVTVTADSFSQSYRSGQNNQRWEIQQVFDNVYYIINKEESNLNSGTHAYASIDDSTSNGIIITKKLELLDSNFLWEVKRYGKYFQIKSYNAPLAWDSISSSSTNVLLKPLKSPFETDLSQLFIIGLFPTFVESVRIISRILQSSTTSLYFIDAELAPTIKSGNVNDAGTWFDLLTVRPSYDEGDYYLIKSQTGPYYLTVDDNGGLAWTIYWDYDKKYYWLIQQGDTAQYNMIVYAWDFKVLCTSVIAGGHTGTLYALRLVDLTDCPTPNSDWWLNDSIPV
jgi:hypothetical protein